MSDGDAVEEVSAKPAKGSLKRKASELFYEKDEVVYAFSGPLLYEAKVVATDSQSTDTPYYIHYKGWKSSHNEWVSSDQLLKFNEENTKHMKKLRQEYKDKKRSKKKAAKAIKVGKIDANMDTIEGEEAGIKITIPIALKKQLVDDWEKVTQKSLLVKLPRSETVSMFLNEYAETKTKKQPELSREVRESVDGIRSYFDLALPKVLLYRFERLQYDSIMENYSDKNKRLSDLYGAEHLLRLFVKLPPLLINIKLTPEDTERLRTTLQDIVKFLSRKTEKYFAPQAYIKASKDYIYAFQHKLSSVIPSSGTDTEIKE